jgi:hypothetical protein
MSKTAIAMRKNLTADHSRGIKPASVAQRVSFATSGVAWNIKPLAVSKVGSKMTVPDKH